MSEALILSRPLAGLKARAAQLRLRAEALARSHPRETIGFGLLGLAIATAIGGAAHSQPEVTPAAVPPAPPPLIMRDVAPAEALKLNAEMPVESGPNPAATPFTFKGDKAAKARALQCLTSAIYYEAGQEST